MPVHTKLIENSATSQFQLISSTIVKHRQDDSSTDQITFLVGPALADAGGAGFLACEAREIFVALA